MNTKIILGFIMLMASCHPPAKKIICFNESFCIYSFEGSGYKNLVIPNKNGFIPVVYDVKSVIGNQKFVLIESYRSDEYFLIDFNNKSVNKSNVPVISQQEYFSILDTLRYHEGMINEVFLNSDNH